MAREPSRINSSVAAQIIDTNASASKFSAEFRGKSGTVLLLRSRWGGCVVSADELDLIHQQPSSKLRSFDMESLNIINADLFQ